MNDSSEALWPSVSIRLLTSGMSLKDLLLYLRKEATEDIEVEKLIHAHRKAEQSKLARNKRIELNIILAEDVDILPQHLIRRLQSLPQFEQLSAVVPAEPRQIKLEKLITFQKFIVLENIVRLEAVSDVYELCLPTSYHPTPFQLDYTNGNFIVTSFSQDLRHIGSRTETVNQLSLGFGGNVVGELRLMLGTAPPFSTVVVYQNRAVILNGYHRAYMLFSKGQCYLPCILYQPRSFDELNFLIGKDIADQWEVITGSAASLVSDFASEQLAESYQVRRKMRQTRISITSESYEISLPGSF